MLQRIDDVEQIIKTETVLFAFIGDIGRYRIHGTGILRHVMHILRGEGGFMHHAAEAGHRACGAVIQIVAHDGVTRRGLPGFISGIFALGGLAGIRGEYGIDHPFGIAKAMPALDTSESMG